MRVPPSRSDTSTVAPLHSGAREQKLAHQPAQPDRLIDEHEAAEILNLKVATLRRWRWAHKGPCWIKLGGSVRYRRSDLDAFMEANRHSPSYDLSTAA